jgi:hypothetical protein
MTSINAIRFNETAGAMVSDENRHWNPERLKSLTVEKTRPVVDERIMAEQRTAAAYANTGSSTIGEELRTKIGREIIRLYDEAREEHGGPPASFLSMYEVARTAFGVQTRVKHTHIDQELRGKFGFTTRDFCAGRYRSDGRTVPISEKGVVDKAEEMITWRGRNKAVRAVFGNQGIVAGVSPRDGFQIFQLSMAFNFWRPAGAPFLALGSGSDAAGFAFLRWARDLPSGRRECDISPVEGTVIAIGALNAARENNLGVDGYFKILLFDGTKTKPEEMYREISDHRSRLLSEVEAAMARGLLPRKRGLEIFEGVAFGGLDFEGALGRLWKGTGNRRRLDRFFRGYAV